MERAGPIDAALRAEIAEARLRILGAGEEPLPELDRLRAVADQFARENHELRERIRELEAKLRQVDVATLVRSLAGAVERASSELEEHRVTDVDAEIRAALRLSPDGAGLVFASPGIYPPSALSTMRFGVRQVPPTREQEARVAAVAAARAAVLEVQEALDAAPARTRRAARRAQAVAASLLEGEPTAAKVVELAAALRPIATHRPRLRAAINALIDRARRVGAADPEELGALTAGLAELAAAIPRARKPG